MGFHFLNQQNFVDFHLSTNENIVFKISKKLNSNENYKKYEVFAEVKKRQFKTIVHVDNNEPELDFIHFYKAKAYVVPVKPPESNFQFDYSKYLGRKNIFYQSYIKGNISSANKNNLNFSEKVKQKRLEILRKIDNSKISLRNRGFLKGIILADRTEMDSETIQDFNRSGLVHLLAISGAHIVIIFGLFYFVMIRLFSFRLKKYAIIASLSFIWVFALFIGFGNSVLRSCAMLTIYFIYVLLERKPDILHSLAFSAFIILMMDTQQLFDVGFQLSFMAVLGIYWLNQPILKYLPRQNNYFKKILYTTISISIAAQLATLPLVLYYFHQFSLISVLANFVIVPFSEFVIVFSFLVVVFISLGINFQFMDGLYDFVIRVLLKCIHWFADVKFVFFENISLNLIEVFALFGIVFLLRFMLVKGDFRNGSHLILASLLFLVIRMSFNIVENQKEEFLVHHYKKGKIISIKKGRQAVFWMNSNYEKEKIQQCIVNPYISSRRIKNSEIKIIPTASKIIKFEGKVYQLD